MTRRLFVLLLTICLMALPFASAEGMTVYVTVVTDGLNVAHEAVEVTDIDNDGAFTADEALACAHDAYYPGGAIEGYDSAVTEYGISLNKLWGVENGGSYGYYLNNMSLLSLADPINDGDSLSVYAYNDLTAWSDVYTYFDAFEKNAAAGEEIALNLYCVSFDENWAPVEMPLDGAVITVNGLETEAVTDENGACVLTLDAGEYVISAVKADTVLVYPVCNITVE